MHILSTASEQLRITYSTIDASKTEQAFSNCKATVANILFKIRHHLQEHKIVGRFSLIVHIGNTGTKAL